MSNVYYNPEAFGLRIVGVLDEDGLCYEYNTLVVWADGAGRVYYAADSGCSCPVPFEEFRSVSELDEVTLSSLASFEGAVRGFPVDAAEQESLIRAVWSLLPR